MIMMYIANTKSVKIILLANPKLAWLKPKILLIEIIWQGLTEGQRSTPNASLCSSFLSTSYFSIKHLDILSTVFRQCRILNHNIGVQQAASYVSTKEALEITQQLGYNFSTTGHSLGAWLAELSLYFCHKDFKYDKVKAVTFDSPGSKEQLDTYEPNVHNAETKGSKNQSNIVIYLSAPNMVNVCNQHIGTVYRLAPEIKYLEVPAFVRELVAKLTPDSIQKRTEQKQYLVEALLSVLVTHSLNPMLDAFNPDTGKPYPDKYSLVLDWPHITQCQAPRIFKL
jgi:hypothetical protein